jgi:hypothetical protein
VNIPTIGGARGIFEIFVPGVFLLVNLAAMVFLLPFIDEDTKSFILDSASNPVLSLVIMVCFAYLLGVILRLFRVDRADRLSASYNRFFSSRAKENRYLFSRDDVPGNDSERLLRFLRDDLAIGWTEKAEILKSDDGKMIRIFKDENSAEIIIDKKKENASLKISDGRTLDLKVKKENGKLNIYKKTLKLWASERFPYIEWIGKVCESNLPGDALKFYNDIWARGFRKRGNRQFFNFCKTMINSEDVRVTSEIYSAEALIRYIAGILYALLIAFCMLSVTAILHFFVFGEIIPTLLLILLAYFFAVVALLKNFRFIRIKEVELVFAATFKYYRSGIMWKW